MNQGIVNNHLKYLLYTLRMNSDNLHKLIDYYDSIPINKDMFHLLQPYRIL